MYAIPPREGMQLIHRHQSELREESERERLARGSRDELRTGIDAGDRQLRIARPHLEGTRTSVSRIVHSVTVALVALPPWASRRESPHSRASRP